ncbi:MAG TPA: hypothetical protein VIH90_02910 [Candidatus Saccharimonadales bacterium]
MAQFEIIEPTALLGRIRNGVEPGDNDAIGARNFAHFLKPHIQGMVDDLRRQTKDGATFGGGIEDVVEVAMTGLQLAVERQADEFNALLPQPEPTATE